MTDAHWASVRDDIAPFYQPVVSLETRRVHGHEVLGRQLTKDGPVSLGPLFHSPTVDEDLKLRMDRRLRQMAIRHLAESPGDHKLFINMKPSWIYQFRHRPEQMPTLRMAHEAGVHPERLVIELTEEHFTGDLLALSEIIKVYKSYGCTIAIDDIGSGFSNFDRIALIEPDILKVDLIIVRKSQTFAGYRSLLQSFSSVAEHIGASLLLEGIETDEDVLLALQMGARYLQGYRFSPAVPDFTSDSVYTASLLALTERYFDQAQQARHQWFGMEDELNQLVDEAWHGFMHHHPADYDQFLAAVAPYVSERCLRMYICTENGDQVSSNYTRRANGRFECEYRHRGSNWMWRPHFFANVMTMKQHNIGILSRDYRDLHSGRPIRTYSRPLNQNRYLFLDIHS